jgi:hypothetical protein
VLINSNNQALSVAQLQALDTNNDGQLTGSETNILRLWQDINEDGHLDTGELANLNTLNHPIQRMIQHIIFESLKFLVGYPALLHFLKHGFFSVQ